MSRYDLQTAGITDVLRACRIHVATGAVDHVLMTQSMPEATRVERAAGGRLNRVVSAKHRFYFFWIFSRSSVRATIDVAPNAARKAMIPIALP
jgi:hypothetical protein